MMMMMTVSEATETSILRVLLVEDDIVHAKMFRRAVREFSSALEVVHVSDGESALAEVARRLRAGRFNRADSVDDDLTPGRGEGSEPIDLILLDLRLPGVDGFEVLRAIRAGGAMRCVPIVIVSTSDRLEEIDRCYRLGANAYFCKPAAFDEMILRLKLLARYWLWMAPATRGEGGNQRRESSEFKSREVV